MPKVVRNVAQLPGSPFDEGARVVALTFDDGPRPPGTPGVLDVLRTEEVGATFFVVGVQATEHPDLLRRIVDDGHTVGLHGWDHRRFTDLDEASLDADLARSTEMLEAVTGARPVLVRPPYGRADERVEAALSARGLVPVKWSLDPEDWRRPDATTIASHVLADAAPGRIVILHDGIRDPEATVEAVPAIVRGLRDAGYQLVAL